MADRTPVQARPPHPSPGLQCAFPRFARNPGTGEPHDTATTLLTADQEVYHDPTHASAVILPVQTEQ
jgi:predicted acyl esterase